MQRLFQEDLNQKTITYARNGIPEAARSSVQVASSEALAHSRLRVIDLVNKKLIVHTQVQSSGYAHVVEHTTGTVSPQAFPNLKIALNQLLLY